MKRAESSTWADHTHPTCTHTLHAVDHLPGTAGQCASLSVQQRGENQLPGTAGEGREEHSGAASGESRKRPRMYSPNCDAELEITTVSFFRYINERTHTYMYSAY